MIAGYLPEPPTDEDDIEVDAVDRLVDEDTLTDLTEIGGTLHDYALLVGSVDCVVIRARGGMHIDGNLNCDIVEALGMPLWVRSMSVDDDVTCGWLDVMNDADIGGNLHCVALSCNKLQLGSSAEVEETMLVRGPDVLPTGPSNADEVPFGEIQADVRARLSPGDLTPSLICSDLKARSIEVRGSIHADGRLQCAGHIRADLSVTACGGITIDADYGVMAGLGISTSLWHTLGFVSTPVPGPRVMTGCFRRLGRGERVSAQWHHLDTVIGDADGGLSPVAARDAAATRRCGY